MNGRKTQEDIEREIYGTIARFARDIERCAMARDEHRLGVYYDGLGLEMRLLATVRAMSAVEKVGMGE